MLHNRTKARTNVSLHYVTHHKAKRAFAAKKSSFSLQGKMKPVDVYRTSKFNHNVDDDDHNNNEFIAPPPLDEYGTPQMPSQPSMKRPGGLFGDLKHNLEGAVQRDSEFLREGMAPNGGKHLLEATAQLRNIKPNKLSLQKKTVDKERVDLSALEAFPYLENLKGAIVHHDLDQILASISGIMKYGNSEDVFNGKHDNEETIIAKIASNMEKHKHEYKVLLDNVKAIPEVISYDLEIVSKLLNQNSSIDKLHCTINTLQHLFNVYHIVPIPLNDPDLRSEHCNLDSIAEKIVKRSEEIDIPENGLEVYKDRHNREPIRIITPLLGAIYMLILKRYGYTSGLVHTPTVGLVFATPPLSRRTVTDPEITERMKQNSPYWYVKNLISDHTSQYKKTTLKLTPVDCRSLCTPSFTNKNIQNLAEDFTCSCLLSPEAAYGGNFIYIDYLVNKVGQIPFNYRPTTQEDKILTGGLDLSSDVRHSYQEKFNWDLPYPIYSYKTLAMRLIYEPIFARDMNQHLAMSLELSASHISSHVSSHPYRPQIQQVEYQLLEAGSSDDEEDEYNDLMQDEEFSSFLNTHQQKGKM